MVLSVPAFVLVSSTTLRAGLIVASLKLPCFAADFARVFVSQQQRKLEKCFCRRNAIGLRASRNVATALRQRLSIVALNDCESKQGVFTAAARAASPQSRLGFCSTAGTNDKTRWQHKVHLIYSIISIEIALLCLLVITISTCITYLSFRNTCRHMAVKGYLLQAFQGQSWSCSR